MQPRKILNVFAVLFTICLNPVFAAETATGSGTNVSTLKTLVGWGWIVAQEKQLAGIEISEPELGVFMRGVHTSLKNEPPPFPLDKIFSDIQTLAEMRRKKMLAATRRKNIAAANAFFADLKKNTNVVFLPDGLAYLIATPGDGAFPRPTQTANVHYTGHLIDGTEFLDLGPFEMVLVTNRVNPGLFTGIQKIRQSGRIKIFVPPRFAESDWEKLGTPPGSAMLFEVELFSVKDTAAQDLADAMTPPAPEPTSLPLSGEFTDAQIIEAWGWNIAKQTGAGQFNLEEIELANFMDGLARGIQGQAPPENLEQLYPQVERFVDEQRKQAQALFKQKQLAQNESFFAGLKKKTNVVFLPDGLAYEIIQPGHGLFPGTNQVAKVNYTGRLVNGRIFDASDPALGPLDVDPTKVFPGWGEGIQKINRGGKIRLYIPCALAYGENGSSSIPPYSTLIFQIELLDFTSP